jgi:hypothetical protein
MPSSLAVHREEFNDVVDTLQKHLTDCAVENGKTQKSITELTQSVHGVTELIEGIKSLFWKAFLAMVGALVTVGVTILVQNWSLRTNADSVHKELSDRQVDRIVQEVRKIQ